ILLTLAYFHLRRSEYSAALDLIRLARKSDPDSVDAARLAGWADYGLNQIAGAVSEWNHAQLLRPDPDVAKALERAQRDAQTESEFREGQSNHFVVRYSGKAEPGLARSIVDTLEEHYSAIRDALNFTPAEPIGVILYTNEEFADITRAPGWAGAVNDGRIRLPVQGVTVVNDQLSRILKHELTHSFIQQKTRGRCPTWLNEGIAQWMEGTQSKLYARALAAQFDAGHVTQLRSLEASWMNLSDNDAAIAYAWSEAVVEDILNSGGTNDLNRLLDALSSSPTPEAAVRAALHMDYSILAQETAAYLRSQQ
ncbi:MAG TPA: peptidase MA family metallohydrolase, partial [Candidatus Acidoferrales bacterium]|nr:peptidase MA family metallohydrolase [Candidatus Acidoferrales bacterium]